MTINLTDPENHPANGPLTVERIERVIKALENSLAYRNGSSTDYIVADAIKGLEELLVNREAEPIYQVMYGNEWRVVNHAQYADHVTHGSTVRIVYASPETVAPDGWKLVPIEPTEDMIIEGLESAPDKVFSDQDVWAEYEKMSGCQKAAHRARLCWSAMLAAAPKLEKI